MILLVELDEMKLLVLGAINSSAPPQAGFLLQQGISLDSYLLLMTLDIQMTLMATSLGLFLALSSLEGMWLVKSSPTGWCRYWLKRRRTGLWLGSWESASSAFGG
jgi:hypothetical protein